MPQETRMVSGHCLLPSQFWSYTPPQKLGFPRPKNENSPLKTGCARPLLKKQTSDPNFFLLLFRLFLSEILSRRCRLSRITSDPAQKVENFRPKLRFPVFRRKNWHDFVSPFSTFANIKGSLPTKSTTPDRLRCRTKTDGEDFPGFWPIHFSNIVKKSFFKRPGI